MKVLYQNHVTARPDALQGTDKDTELLLPNNVFASLRAVLLESTFLIPERARKLQDWDVGLLDRFEDACPKSAIT